MIYGIGTDIVEVSRIERSICSGNGFAKKVFSEHEIIYCNTFKYASQHYAARFAAKEALLKALGTGWAGEMEFYEIEVRNNEKGKPELYVSGKVKEILEKENISGIHVSLSHTATHAVAMVVLEII
jgi:holo-[acyl-carrier protein] synthase